MPDSQKWRAPEALTADHDVSGFDCGEAVLDLWLKHTVLRNERRNASRTYVLCVEQRVVAYYCLSTGSITSELTPSRMRRNMPDPIPVMVLGRLAIALAWQRQGFGKALLHDAILRALHVSEMIGVTALMVHALSDQAVQFYQAQGFQPSPMSPRTLFLLLQDIRKAI
ncbi:GNAT family N-acetyltransferase [Methylomicrobium agile]|uniref:GNAT family N-acetyltransferase n=1 Tax=Methylomicrobium agile TaxID=39774 RepID=UPI0004DEEF08|nr:GNAT family N-acetyltransferase [Methylomicrobium agile]